LGEEGGRNRKRGTSGFLFGKNRDTFASYGGCAEGIGKTPRGRRTYRGKRGESKALFSARVAFQTKKAVRVGKSGGAAGRRGAQAKGGFIFVGGKTTYPGEGKVPGTHRRIPNRKRGGRAIQKKISGSDILGGERCLRSIRMRRYHQGNKVRRVTFDKKGKLLRKRVPLEWNSSEKSEKVL